MAIRIPNTDIKDLLGWGGEHWLQGAWKDDKGNMCLHYAIRLCAPQRGDAFLIQQIAQLEGWGLYWNDAMDTRWEDIEKLLAVDIEVTDEDLAETFGPQWREIVTFVRRCAVITEPEARELSAAWVASRVASRDAAVDAARVASRDAAVDAAVDAAWNASVDAARVAARVAAAAPAAAAARALSCRDLVGDKFTQADYDLLTGSYRQVIGPIHPDDEKVST